MYQVLDVHLAVGIRMGASIPLNHDLSFAVKQYLHGHGCKIFHLPAIDRKKNITVSQPDIVRTIIHSDPEERLAVGRYSSPQ